MTALAGLETERIREFFDLRSSYNEHSGGGYRDDPYPAWRALREKAEVHEGIVHELTGYAGPASFAGLPHPERPHFSAFGFAACDEAFRNQEIFASSLSAIDPVAGRGIDTSMLWMGGEQHRRYRALVQPSFVPSRAAWWMDRWITSTVGALVDGFADRGRAELNVDFCAAIPVLTITGSFGVPVAKALDVRAALRSTMGGAPDDLLAILAPIVAARREKPEDDLLSVLVEAELKESDGVHRLSDPEIYSFAILLLMAGSGTTWKQMGILLATLLERPELLERIRSDRNLVKAAVEECVRWMPTDPMFARFVTRDVEFHGVSMPVGSVLHLCLGAANRDPARWVQPDAYDIDRKPMAHVGFGSGPHMCLGMHVARAEMSVALNTLLDRLPNLRLDPEAEPPRMIGMYERGATEIPVVWG